MLTTMADGGIIQNKEKAIRQFMRGAFHTDLALVQITYDLLDEPLLQLLLGPHMLPVSRYQMRCAGFVGPLG